MFKQVENIFSSSSYFSSAVCSHLCYLCQDPVSCIKLTITRKTLTQNTKLKINIEHFIQTFTPAMLEKDLES